MTPSPSWRLVVPVACVVACAGQADKDDGADPANTAPVVTIDAPRDGATVNTPEAVRLQGSATDDEDGDLSGEALVWSSSQDGDLGTGTSLTTPLSLGEHTITLVATDAGGLDAEASVDLTVTDVNESPVPVILAPEDGAALLEGETLSLEGVADDVEDGALTGASLLWTSSLDGLLGSGSTLDVPTPTVGEHVITLTAVDRQGAEASTAISVLVAPLGSNLPPSVQIDAPADGASFPLGTDLSLEGTATDPEDGPLTGSSLTWTSSLDGSLGIGSPRVASGLSQGVHTLTLTATDGEGLSRDDAIVVAINPAGNAAPSVSLSSPAPGSVWAAGDDVPLEASAVDPEDGTLPGSSLSWTSSLDGTLGTGSTLSAPLTTVGAHTLTVTATDSGGAQGVASVGVVVQPANQPPTATILAPASGSTYSAGSLIAFEGEGDDPEDGALTGASLLWQSNLDGPLGSGETLGFASLTAGTHQVSLTAVDSGGRTDSDTITVEVTPSSVNLPPVASLSAPAGGAVGSPTTFDASGSTDPDGTLVDFTFDFGDGSAPVSGTASSVDHVWTSDGTYNATVTVTDDDGDTASASVVVTVVIPPRLPEVVLDAPSALGDYCRLVLDAADAPHLVFRDQGYGQLWYGHDPGTGWMLEMVEGPGLQVGGIVGDSADLALSPTGEVHIAYTLGDTVRLATQSPTGWDIEIPLVPEPYDTRPISLGHDPAQGGRPTVVYTTSTGGELPVVAWRLPSGAWQAETWTAAPNTFEYTFRGGFVFGSQGTALLTVYEDGAGVVPWSAAAGFGAYVQVASGPTNDFERVPVLLDASGQAILMYGDGVAQGLGTTWTLSDVANSALDRVALTWDAVLGEPVAAFRNDQGQLEVIRPGPPGLYWSWEVVGAVDGGDDLGLAVDSTGEVHACFFRDGNLLYY